jgi:hypothetical protein
MDQDDCGIEGVEVCGLGFSIAVVEDCIICVGE